MRLWLYDERSGGVKYSEAALFRKQVLSGCGKAVVSRSRKSENVDGKVESHRDLRCIIYTNRDKLRGFVDDGGCMVRDVGSKNKESSLSFKDKTEAHNGGGSSGLEKGG